MTDGPVIVVIPARYASERFPGKALADIAGQPMVVRVLRNMTAATTIDRVLVATDDERIADVVRAAGGEVAMTSALAPSGTDRVWEAVRDIPASIVVNVQGDEPLLDASVVDAVVGRLADGDADVTTPVTSIPRLAAASTDIVTVATDERGRAHYFSRSTIPYGADPVWRHIGLYAYRRDALQRFVAAPPAPLEQVERLEQLRALAIGLRIDAVEVACDLQAVDRPSDVALVEARLAGRAPAAAPVRLVVLDVDGVLTDGGITYGEADGQLLTFDVKDGFGIVSLVRAGIDVAILSARDSVALRRRCAELGVREIRTGIQDKATELPRLCADLGVTLGQVCYVGDDDPDVPAMRLAGRSAAPADASAGARAAATIQLTRAGGHGAVRELADLLLGVDGR